MIRFLTKYVSHDALDQLYKLYVRPHLDYGDTICHRYDPFMTQDVTGRLEQTSAAPAVTRAQRDTMNCDGKISTIGDLDVSAT